jgi:predicted membrane chloride channel (bestrophin family)
VVRSLPTFYIPRGNICISISNLSFFNYFELLQEGRKIWENILSKSRNLSRMLQLYSEEVGSERKERILKLVAAYPYLLRQHIRPGCLCAKKDQFIEEQNKLLLHENRRSVPETRHEGQKHQDYDFLKGGVRGEVTEECPSE